jgi:hypothetical protein
MSRASWIHTTPSHTILILTRHILLGLLRRLTLEYFQLKFLFFPTYAPSYTSVWSSILVYTPRVTMPVQKPLSITGPYRQPIWIIRGTLAQLMKKHTHVHLCGLWHDFIRSKEPRLNLNGTGSIHFPHLEELEVSRNQHRGIGKTFPRKRGCGGGKASEILNLGTTWRWVASYIHLPLYPEERAPDIPELIWTPWRREKTSCPYRDSNSDSLVVRPVA